MRRVYLGLGTNMNHRDSWLDRGLALLEDKLVSKRGLQSMTLSDRYETEPWGMSEGTPAFVNMAVAIETDLALTDLLHIILNIEEECGRIRDNESNGYMNRTLDIDVLCTSDNEQWDGMSPEGLSLKVPHPRMMFRRFVLQPLSDLDANLQVSGVSIATALAQCPQEPSVRRRPFNAATT